MTSAMKSFSDRRRSLAKSFGGLSPDRRSSAEEQISSTKSAKMTSLKSYRHSTMKAYNIMVEYKQLKQHPLGGVYVMPSFDDLHTLYGVIFVRMGLYRNGIFKFRIDLARNYPADNATPKVTFVSKVYHPMVDAETGVLDLRSRFPTWRTGKDYIVLVLSHLKKIFYLKDYNVRNPTNAEAATLFSNDRKAYLEQVELCVDESLQRRYVNEPGSTLRFTEYKSQHEKVRKSLLGEALGGDERSGGGGQHAQAAASGAAAMAPARQNGESTQSPETASAAVDAAPLPEPDAPLPPPPPELLNAHAQAEAESQQADSRPT